jgi:NAD(P)-dependent dehydrogenase (short-subunit alcohol dehydrogenase family)
MTRWNFFTNGSEVVEAFKDRAEGRTSLCFLFSYTRLSKLMTAVLITGPSTGGIGAETALSLAIGKPSLLILTGRTEAKISPIIKEIHAKHPSVIVEFVPMDLSSLASVRNAATKINALAKRIDILILNAAVMLCPFKLTEDGVEMHFGTNYLGHFLLTNLVRGAVLNAGEGARIVCLSSSAHNSGRVRFEDVNFQARERL